MSCLHPATRQVCPCVGFDGRCHECPDPTSPPPCLDVAVEADALKRQWHAVRPVQKVSHWVPMSAEVAADIAPARRFFDKAFERAAQMRRYGWLPPRVDANPFPRLRLWRWWP